MRRAALGLALVLTASCRPAPGPPAALAAGAVARAGLAPRPPAALAPWTDARTLELAVARPAPDRTERLELRHEPNPAEPARARLKLVFVLPEGEQVLVDERVSLEQRDAAWGASYQLIAEPPPGARRAVSDDGGKTYLALLPLGVGRWAFCPHQKVEAVNGTPSWPEMLALERWAAGLLETAVWAATRRAGGASRARWPA
jgi:hypothetical protein